MTDIEILESLKSYTCKPEVVDKAIKALEQEPKILNTLDFAIDASSGDTNYFVGFRNGLRYSKSLIDGKEPQFESCTEQEPKTGHWIPIRKSTGTIVAVKCECCGGSPRHGHKTDYCPNCGAKMESEDR